MGNIKIDKLYNPKEENVKKLKEYLSRDDVSHYEIKKEVKDK